MKIDLARMAVRRGFRRKSSDLAVIRSTGAQAQDLFAIYRRMLAPLADAAQRILPAYARDLERKLRHDSPDELADLADDLAEEINRLVLELTPDLRDWALRIEKVHRGKWARTVRSVLEVTIETMLGPEDMRETLEAFLVRHTSLIRDVGEQARGRIADAVLRGIQQRTPIETVAREIRGATGFARARARRIASHQSVALNSALNEERRRQAGLSTWRWRHSRKAHPRLEHVARDGLLYSDDNQDWGREVNGELIRKPPEDGPGELPNCGCTGQAVLLLPDD